MKKLLTLILVAFMLVGLLACDYAELELSELPPLQSDESLEWAIYWYLCGSDLESEYGLASGDLLEMMEVNLPQNVKIVIQTGGAQLWQNDTMDGDKLQRYVYDSDGLHLLEEKPLGNMGDSQTLINFLDFANENYPANRRMVCFWNHGGGSVSGATFDENYYDEYGNMDSLTLREMNMAFNAVFEENPDNPPIDIIGFDTCLMATIDTAFAFSAMSKYLVASEELEPGGGWLYSAWLNELAHNPSMDPLELSKVICDTYLEGCEIEGTDSDITLSVTNISKLNDLLFAYDEFGKEALGKAVEDPGFFAHFSKIANNTENYGGNTRNQGYTNMVDLGHLAKESEKLLPKSYANVISALDDCIEYKVNGKYRPESMGLACYYPYNGDIDDFNIYASIGPSQGFKYFYLYSLTGDLPQEGMDYISEMNYEKLPELQILKSVLWEDMPVTVDDEGTVTLNLGREANNILSSIAFELYYADLEEDIMLCLGTNDDIIADWDRGIFKDNFRGTWGSIDGHLCYMEIVHEGENYSRYSVPILLNHEEYNLMVIYDFDAEEYYIEGARKPLDYSGAADKNLRSLHEGDEIQTIHYASDIDEEDDEFIAIPIDTFKVSSKTAFDEIYLMDGLYIMMYLMKDSQNNLVYSAAFTFDIVDGEIYTSID